MSIDCPLDHASVSPRIQAQVGALAALSYEEVPRGRVLFLKRRKRFVVYLDKALTVTNVKKALKEFQLPLKSTTFETDSRYTTDPAELDRIIGES